MTVSDGLQRLWYGPAWWSLPLWPFSWIFGLGVAARRGLYGIGVLRQTRVDVPVIVVGNVTVGGTGKTPIAAWLARQLTMRGRRVAVVLRGYGGSQSRGVRVVSANDDAQQVGDEALVHVRRDPHVVVIGADRVAAVQRAVKEGAEVVVCDDGLQHLALARDYEIVVVDAERGFGNGHLLPAGPLREPPRRIEEAGAVVLTRRRASEGVALRVRRPFLAEARLSPGAAVNVLSGERRDLESLRGQRVGVVAGIGNPSSFFDALRAEGLDVEAYALPDHAPIDPAALPFAADATVLMTEKDAVKCRQYAQPGWWYVELEVSLGRQTARDLLALILDRIGLTGAGVDIG